MIRWMAGLALALGASMAVAEPASLDDYMDQARHAPNAAVHYGPAPSQVAELFLPQEPRVRIRSWCCCTAAAS